MVLRKEINIRECLRGVARRCLPSKKFLKIVYVKVLAMSSGCVPFSIRHQLSGDREAYKILCVCVEVCVCSLLQVDSLAFRETPPLM